MSFNNNHSETLPLRADDDLNNIESNSNSTQVGKKSIKKTWILGLIITIIILTGLGLLIYFFFPRYPKVGFYRMELNDNSTKDGKSSHSLFSAIKEKRDNIELGMKMYLYANSTLYFDLNVKNITVDGYMKLDNGDYIHVGQGHLQSPLTIPKRTTYYKFTMPITIKYSTNSTKVEGSERALNEFLSKCGLDNHPRDDITIKYIAHADIPLISWIGYKPSFTKVIRFACPLKLDILNSIRSVMKWFK